MRPFNKWLVFELETEPLRTPGFADLTERGDRVGPDPTADRIRDAFRLLETAAIRAGHGAVVDGWQPDVAWLRGEDANRRSDALRSPVTGASLEG